MAINFKFSDPLKITLFSYELNIFFDNIGEKLYVAHVTA